MKHVKFWPFEYSRIGNISELTIFGKSVYNQIHEDKWMDISTAPKDGSWIFIYHREYGNLIISKWLEGNFSVHSNFPQPTHWMPFPALPEQPNPKGNQ